MQPVDYFGTLETEDELYTDIKIPDFPAHVYYLLFRVAQTG